MEGGENRRIVLENGREGWKKVKEKRGKVEGQCSERGLEE